MKLSLLNLILMLLVKNSSQDGIIRINVHKEYQYMEPVELSKNSPKKLSSAVKLRNYDNVSFSGLIKMGTPPKEFRVIFDTESSVAWLPLNHSVLDNSAPLCQYFDGKSSKTYNETGSKYQSESFGKYTISGHTASDVITVGDFKFRQEFILAKFVSIGCGKMSGMVGLGFNPQSTPKATFMDNLLKQKNVNKPVFSFYFSNKMMADGELLIGGINTNLFKGNLTYISLSNQTSWQIPCQGIKGMGQPSKNFQAIISTRTSNIVVPKEYKYNFQRQASKSAYEGLKSCKTSGFPSITFLFGGHEFTLSPEDYILKSFQDLKVTCYLGIQFEDLDLGGISKPFLVGDIFIKKYYTVFDFGKKRIGFALADHPNGSTRTNLNFALITIMVFVMRVFG